LGGRKGTRKYHVVSSRDFVGDSCGRKKAKSLIQADLGEKSFVSNAAEGGGGKPKKKKDAVAWNAVVDIWHQGKKKPCLFPRERSTHVRGGRRGKRGSTINMFFAKSFLLADNENKCDYLSEQEKLWSQGKNKSFSGERANGMSYAHHRGGKGDGISPDRYDKKKKGVCIHARKRRERMSG